MTLLPFHCFMAMNSNSHSSLPSLIWTDCIQLYVICISLSLYLSCVCVCICHWGFAIVILHVLRFVLSVHVLWCLDFFLPVFLCFYYNSGILNKTALWSLPCLRAVRDRKHQSLQIQQYGFSYRPSFYQEGIKGMMSGIDCLSSDILLRYYCSDFLDIGGGTTI